MIALAASLDSIIHGELHRNIGHLKNISQFTCGETQPISD
jgi:hypothetical protein